MKYVNEAGWDRIVRVVLGIVMLYLGWAGTVAGGWGTFLRIIGFLPLVTGLVGICPAYALFKFHTNKTAA